MKVKKFFIDHTKKLVSMLMMLILWSIGVFFFLVGHQNVIANFFSDGEIKQQLTEDLRNVPIVDSETNQELTIMQKDEIIQTVLNRLQEKYGDLNVNDISEADVIIIESIVKDTLDTSLTDNENEAVNLFSVTIEKRILDEITTSSTATNIVESALNTNIDDLTYRISQAELRADAAKAESSNYISQYTDLYNQYLETLNNLNVLSDKEKEDVDKLKERIDGINVSPTTETVSNEQITKLTTQINETYEQLQTLLQSSNNNTDLTNTINDLTSRLEQLETDYTQLVSDMNTNSTNLSTAQGDITTIQGDITNIKNDISGINTTNTGLQSQIDAINTALSSTASNTTITNMQTDISNIQGDITNITNAIGDSTSGIIKDIDDVQSAIGTTNNNLTNLTTTVTNLNDTVTNNYSTLNSSISTLSGDLTALQNLITNNNVISRLDAIDGTNGRLDTIETNYTNLITNTIGDINTDITNIKGDITDLQNDVSDNASNIASLQGDVDGIKTILNGTAGNNGLVNTVNTLSSTVSSISSDLSSLTSTVGTHTNNISTIQGNITTLEGRITAVENDLVTVKSNITAITGRVSTLETKVDTLETNYSTLAGKVSTLETNYNALDGRVDTLEDTTIPAITSRIETLEANEANWVTNTTYNTLADRVTAAETNINNITGTGGRLETIEGNITNNANNISALDGRLDTVEDTINNSSTGILKKIENLNTQLTTLSGNLSNSNNDISGILNMIAPEYDATKTYSTGDLVRKDGYLYKALTNVSAGTAVTDTAKWKQTALSMELGAYTSGGGGTDTTTLLAQINDLLASSAVPSEVKTAQLTPAKTALTNATSLDEISTASSNAQKAIIKALIAANELNNSTTSNYIAPTYSSSATYNTGDVVIHNNTIYQATADGVSNSEPSSTNTNWEVITVNDLMSAKDKEVLTTEIDTLKSMYTDLMNNTTIAKIIPSSITTLVGTDISSYNNAQLAEYKEQLSDEFTKVLMKTAAVDRAASIDIIGTIKNALDIRGFTLSDSTNQAWTNISNAMTAGDLTTLSSDDVAQMYFEFIQYVSDTFGKEVYRDVILEKYKLDELLNNSLISSADASTLTTLKNDLNTLTFNATINYTAIESKLEECERACVVAQKHIDESQNRNMGAPWTAGTYSKGAIVMHNNSLWKANADTAATDVPGTSSKWSVTTVAEILGNIPSIEYDNSTGILYITP